MSTVSHITKRQSFLIALVVACVGFIFGRSIISPQQSHQADSHLFITPSTDDSRSPCPALNALANHGYLPRSGRNLHHSDILGSLVKGFGLSYPLASVITFGSYALLRQIPPVSLSDIARRNGVEHNCSLAHLDILGDFEYGPRSADMCLLQELLRDSHDGRHLDIQDIARARVRRENAPEYKMANFTLDSLHSEIARGEMALMLGIFGTEDGQLSIEFLVDWFLQERLPAGWRPRKTQGLLKTYKTSQQMKKLMTLVQPELR